MHCNRKIKYCKYDVIIQVTIVLVSESDINIGGKEGRQKTEDDERHSLFVSRPLYYWGSNLQILTQYWSLHKGQYHNCHYDLAHGIAFTAGTRLDFSDIPIQLYL